MRDDATLGSVRPRTAHVVGLAVLGTVLASTAAAEDRAVAQQQIAFLRGTRVFFAAADGSSQRPTTLPGYPAWSRDGRRLVVYDTRNGRVFVANRDGAGRREIDRVRAGWCVSLEWSADGRRILSAIGCDVDMTDLFVSTRDGSKKRQLRPRFWNYGPVWAPNGSRILLASEPVSNYWRHRLWGLYTVDAVTGRSRRIPGSAFAPGAFSAWAWSRDGRRVFMLDESRSEVPQLFVIPVSGGRFRKLTGDEFQLREFAVSPDGRSIAFTAAIRRSDWEIYVINSDGTDLRQLTDNQRVQDIEPAWSPNSRQIAFTSNRDGNQEIYVMNADGRDPRNISQSPARDEAPTWIPPLR